MKLMTKVLWAALAATVAQGAAADVEGERAALSRVIHELEALAPLLAAAASQADADARHGFRHELLRLDIDRVKSGIEERLVEPRTQPRSFPPLKGDYRR